jgi:uncharacterized membrane protein
VAVAASIGAAVGLTVSPVTPWQASLLVGWDGAALSFLIWTWSTIGGMDGPTSQAHTAIEDPSRRMAESTVVAAGVALLAAVGLALIRAGQAHGGTKAMLITVGMSGVLLSWATVHTVFTLRYARAYYREPVGGVDFNGEPEPCYVDFAYLAFTIGMTFQVSDTNLSGMGIRRIALGHALLSYLFGAVIVALSINVVASLL